MTKTTRLTQITVSAAVVALLAGACSGSDGEATEPTSSADVTAVGTGTVPGSVLRVNWGGFPESWAPGAEMEAGFMRVPYENLVARVDNEIQPVLATAWEQTDETLTLTLREGVTFHDGTPFDAEAVKVNIETVKNTPGPYAGPFQVVESIDVVDDHTVTLNLAQPAPSLLTTMTTRALPIASPTAIEDGSVAQTPVGTGPWAYDAATSVVGTRLVFGPHADYWGDPVGFETIQIVAIPEDNAASAALATGEIDLTDTEVNQLQTMDGDEQLDHLSYPAIRNNPMFFDRGPGGMFEDVAVRQAACYAIDTQVLASLEPDWEVRTQHFAEGEQGYNPDITGYTHDLAKAQELYDGAGNPPVDAEMLATTFNENQMQIYAEQMGEIGMDVTVQSAPPPQYFSEWNSGRYPLGLGGNDELTPYDWYNAWFAADAPGNPSGAESDELKAAADAAIAAGSSEEADALWAEVTKIIADEALTCAHVAGEELIAWNTETVTGVAAPTEHWETNLVNYRDLRPANG
ncbi:putative D,D-dipeptide-binding periplasmic protein DdpA precursor [Isoptericola dokdonensis DS-3]|uniref:Putative D,D-dipeptide-binding periplasmic protein DdpA n=1 Tax=Isoptericola dokdonensis DS-3 TaxID=1300344 RepID=A0A161I2P7_9MICO|nr:putative D,D-dipeptide-binding periplasmic protein DdpA precursor [Isoptericola dokdonensis DS-3]